MCSLVFVRFTPVVQYIQSIPTSCVCVELVRRVAGFYSCVCVFVFWFFLPFFSSSVSSAFSSYLHGFSSSFRRVVALCSVRWSSGGLYRSHHRQEPEAAVYLPVFLLISHACGGGGEMEGKGGSYRDTNELVHLRHQFCARNGGGGYPSRSAWKIRGRSTVNAPEEGSKEKGKKKGEVLLPPNY